MTDGASAVAHRYGIPSLVIGMTIVAMGSSAPELVVSSVSAVQGKTDISIGNVVGSNIFNILGIIGITALVSPIAASRGNVRREGERRDALPFRLAARDALKRSDERRAENRARAHAAALRDVGGNLDVEPAMREVELRHRERALYESAPVVRILRCADFGKRL